MEQKGSQSLQKPKPMSFLVRRVSQHNLHAPPQLPKAESKLTVEPQSVTFVLPPTSKVSIAKLALTSNFHFKVEFKVKQAREEYFKVRYSKNTLTPGETVELFLFFNTETYTAGASDQIVLSASDVMLVVPIQIRGHQEQVHRGRKLHRPSKTRDNAKMLKIQARVPREDGRKHGVMYPMEKNSLELAQKENRTLQGRITRFLEQYRRVEAFLKDKAIKNEIYYGEKPISKQKYFSIIEFNLNIEMVAKQLAKQSILTRFESQNSKDGPSVRQFDNIRLQWSKIRNQPKITYRKGLDKLFRQVRNIVIFHRFRRMNKVLSIYKNLKDEEHIEPPLTKIINRSARLDTDLDEYSEECSLLSNEDQEDREHQRQIEQKKKHDYYCRKISKMLNHKMERDLGADFTVFSLSPRLLPLDYQEPESKKTLVFEIKPRIGFDNWVMLEDSVQYTHEVMGYSKMDRMNQWDCLPAFEEKHHHKISNQKLGVSLKTEGAFQQLGVEIVDPFIRQVLIREYRQSCEIQTPQFRAYDSSATELDLLPTNTIESCELDALKPLVPALRTLSEVKNSKLDYLPYCESPLPAISDSLLGFPLNGTDESPLIHKISRNDRLDFQELPNLMKWKKEYVEEITRESQLFTHWDVEGEANSVSSLSQSSENRFDCLEARFSAQFDTFNSNFRNECWEPQHSGEQQHEQQLKDDRIFENILSNLKKTATRRFGTSTGKTASFNSFAKSNYNRIYY